MSTSDCLGLLLLSTLGHHRSRASSSTFGQRRPKVREEPGPMTGTSTPDRTAQVGTLVSSQPWYARLFTAPLHSPGTLVSSQPWCSTQSPKRAPLISARKCSARRPRLSPQVLSAIPEASASDLLDLDLDDLGASEREIWDPEVKSGGATVAPSLVACKRPPSLHATRKEPPLPLPGCMQMASLCLHAHPTLWLHANCLSHQEPSEEPTLPRPQVIATDCNGLQWIAID